MIPESIRNQVKDLPPLAFLFTPIEKFSQEDLVVLVKWLSKENDKLKAETFRLMREPFE